MGERLCETGHSARRSPAVIAERDRQLTASPSGDGNELITSTAMTSLAPPVSGATGSSGTRAGRRLDLDVVRGLAIVLALGWHFSGEQSGNAVVDALTWPGHMFGWAGVDLFFVLSGFLLGRLVLTEQARTGRFDGRRFTARRLLKLWPVLYVFLAVQALAGPEAWTSYLWQNALHVQNYAGTSLTHLWSLAVEEHFYLALAVLFPLFARRRGSPRVLAAILVGVLVAALALRIWGAVHGVSDVRLQWRSHYRVDSLAAGVLLALVSIHWPERFERLRARRGLLLGVLAAGVLHLVTVGKQGPVGSTVGFTVAYLTAGALLLLLYRAAWVPRARWITAPVALLGRYSYGIYIWHVFAAAVALDLVPGTGPAPETASAQAVKYGAAVAVGVLATVAVEKPVLRLRDRLLPAKDHHRSSAETRSIPMPVRQEQPVGAAA
jgi:peptidoglycan/LPS O-acetylase OafA/YrhL